MNVSLPTRRSARALALLAALLVCVFPASAGASSHREAPGISKYPQWDNTDVYAFRDPIVTDQLTILANWIPLEDPSGFPNFFHFDEHAWYQIHIDNDGDGVEDITYRFIFTENVRNPDSFLNFLGPVSALNDPNINVYYTYTVDKIIGVAGNGVPPANITRIGSGLLELPNNAGPATYPGAGGYSSGAGLIAGVYTVDGNTKVFAGPRSDMFFVDLGWLGDLLNFRPGVIPGNHQGGINGVAGFNTHVIGMQIPLFTVTKNGLFPSSISDPNSIIGIWSDTWVPQNRVFQATGAKPVLTGPFVQVSRLGVPLVNEVVIPYGSKDRFNATLPKDDAQYAPFVLDPEVPKLLKLLFNIDSPPAPRTDLVAVVQGVPGLTQRPGEVIADELRINLAVPPTAIAPVDKTNRMGVLGGDLAGFPNGRRPWDDIVDIELQILAGVLVPAFNKSPNNALGDGVDGPEKPFLAGFPYLRSPSNGLTHSHDNPPQVLHPSQIHTAEE
ncbi:MAG TPA: DUF4331 domain-containing protein [Thermoanaerobaculia bacterium]|nr:DUF4331 domain-containing protein [Thermoanaerobaculia bacterium]